MPEHRAVQANEAWPEQRGLGAHEEGLDGSNCPPPGAFVRGFPSPRVPAASSTPPGRDAVGARQGPAPPRRRGPARRPAPSTQVLRLALAPSIKLVCLARLAPTSGAEVSGLVSA